ncbi:SURF1 family protein [Microbacterium luticocti]|uniref:SURF1 family protein n=1 Tax=Microbacterium luticocti TaxID=451764 RepID=UPI00041F4706|nr:SURF1 family cytochrome oxidase biogenesis protein [Microbacterium luticocti]
MSEPVTDDLPEVFPPTLREVMLRPRWLAMLGLCLVVAGVFAWLGQWQLGRALDTVPVEPGQTEKIVPIDEVVAPGQYLNAPLVGQKVTARGHFVPGDFLVVSRRMNDGVEGFWVTGQFRLDTATPTSLAVAVGWAPTLTQAKDAAAALNAASPAASTVTGRLISDEGPALPPRDDPYALTTMSPAALLGRWHDVADLAVYRPYLTDDTALGGLQPISSHIPEEQGGLNWLNLFYAAEWAVFAGFAFYLWYRLAKDAWEKEVEELEDAAAQD